MESVLPSRSLRSAARAAFAVWLLSLQVAQGAAVRNEPIEFNASGGTEGNLFGILTLLGPKVTQGSTLLTAQKGQRSSTDGGNENSTWVFTGNVHLEFDGAVLDAQAATAVFVNNQLRSVDVQSTAPQLPKKL